MIKHLSNIAYFAIMLCLGFVIYHYLLNPQAPLNNKQTHNNALSTAALFASTLPNQNGVNQDLSQYQGKVIVLNFWATWCPPCREEMPELSQLYTDYETKNVVVLGIAIDELAVVKDFATQMPVSYPIFASEEAGSALNNQLGNDKGVLPYTVIINTKGQVVKTHFGRINKAMLITDLRPIVTP